MNLSLFYRWKVRKGTGSCCTSPTWFMLICLRQVSRYIIFVSSIITMLSWSQWYEEAHLSSYPLKYHTNPRFKIRRKWRSSCFSQYHPEVSHKRENGCFHGDETHQKVYKGIKFPLGSNQWSDSIWQAQQKFSYRSRAVLSSGQFLC